MRLRTHGALAALPLVLALALTGCGSDDEGGGVASVNGDRKVGGTSTPSADPAEMGVKFAQCMRENGVPMDDPEPGKGPMLKLDKKSGIGKEQVDKAMNACRKYSPQQNAGPGGDAKAEERNRKFAECMRKNGVEEFPDPKPGQRGVMITGEVGKDPDLPAAQKKCQEVLGGGGPGAGAGQ